MKYSPVPKEILEKTKQMIDALVMINNIKRNKSRCDLSGYLKKVVAWTED